MRHLPLAHETRAQMCVSAPCVSCVSRGRCFQDRVITESRPGTVGLALMPPCMQPRHRAKRPPCLQLAAEHTATAVTWLCVWAALVAATNAQSPLPPTVPCGWRAVWNASLGEYAYRNVFTGETWMERPAAADGGSSLPQNTCPAAYAIGTYGGSVPPIL